MEKVEAINGTDSVDIVCEFTQWNPRTGPCPISVNDKYWFKKLYNLAERCASAENELKVKE